MVNRFHPIAQGFDGEAFLGRPLRTVADLRAAIRDSVPQRVLAEVARLAGLSVRELTTALDLTPSNLRRRRGGRFTQSESDRLYRLARIVALARLHLGDDLAATRWLKLPNSQLGGQAPLGSIDTDDGSRAVENVLGRIACGGPVRDGPST